MNEELKKRIDDQDQMIGRIWESVEKTRKYFLWTMIGSIAMFVLPMLGLLMLIPKLMGALSSQMSTINSLGL